jgi:outer membrane murein-binding lipoprotein Lpp
MFNTKMLLAAASLAVLSAAGAGVANAAPWEVRHDRQELRHDRQDLRQDRRELRHDQRFEHRALVDRIRIADGLRFHRYRMIGDPYFVHGRYVVRTHDRFGRIVFVQVDPYTGSFMREVIL